jgi:glycerophosphoryl diester phosphodiesterase
MTIDVIAHRGASAHAPEHTLAAFDLALTMGADALELDLRATADGQVLVLHDETLARTAGDPRHLRDLTSQEIELLPPAVRPVPLTTVLDRYGAATRYLLELKEPIEVPVWTAVHERGLAPRVQLQAFSRRTLRRAHWLAPAASLAQLYLAHTPSALIRRDLGRVARFAHAVGPHHRSVDAALVAAAHAHGLAVRPYTVDREADMTALIALGVDGLITNRPAVARAAVAARDISAAA